MTPIARVYFLRLTTHVTLYLLLFANTFPYLSNT